MTVLTASLYREYELPWSADRAQERKFRRLLAAIMLVALVLSLLWPFLPTREPDVNEAIEIPQRIANILFQEEIEPPPVPEMTVPDEPEPSAAPEPAVEEMLPPEPEPEPEVDRMAVAREQAQAALLPFAEDLASLVDQDLASAMADGRPLTATVAQAERNERSLITSSVGAASTGINTANMSRNTGGTGMAARATTRVDSDAARAVRQQAGARRTGASGKASRSREEIELVFDRNKGAIFALYNRALRRDPSLEGQLVLRLTITPGGEVIFCEIVSSELGDAELENKLVQRVRLFRFEARDVEAITTTKPIDFFPT